MEFAVIFFFFFSLNGGDIIHGNYLLLPPIRKGNDTRSITQKSIIEGLDGRGGRGSNAAGLCWS